MMSSNRVIVVDVETTGLSIAKGGRVIEIGAVLIDDGVTIAELATLIDTGASISRGAYLVHGISEEMLRGGPQPSDAWPAFLDFVGDTPLVAHNSPFDSAFIRNELTLMGLVLRNRWFCTVRLSRKRLPHLPNHRLDTVYRHLFGEMPSNVQRHRALDDARLTARIWGELNSSSRS